MLQSSSIPVCTFQLQESSTALGNLLPLPAALTLRTADWDFADSGRFGVPQDGGCLICRSTMANLSSDRARAHAEKTPGALPSLFKQSWWAITLRRECGYQK